MQLIDGLLLPPDTQGSLLLPSVLPTFSSRAASGFQVSTIPAADQSLCPVMVTQENNMVYTSTPTFAYTLYMWSLLLCMPDSKDHLRASFQAIQEVNTGEI